MDNNTLSVSEFGSLFQAALEQIFPYGFWLAGEISGLKRSRGHVYFDLVERADASSAGEPPVASVSVVLWSDARDRVNSQLKRHGNAFKMHDGTKIRIQVIPDYYTKQGRFQLRMTAIDPTYTIGLQAAERDVLLRALKAEGLIDRNSLRRIPDVPLRIGLVTSLGSAAHADILTVIDSSGYAFSLIEADAVVQGNGAEISIAAALRTLDHPEHDVDIILLARGGGSRNDLSVFDHELVARAIAGCRVPVITGIGHDIDRSVADEVAHQSSTTPTAAARTVVDLVTDWLAALDAREATLASSATAAVDRQLERLNRNSISVVRAARRTCFEAGNSLDSRATRAQVAGQHCLRSASHTLDRISVDLERQARLGFDRADTALESIKTRVRALDPARALARGWSITQTTDGSVVRSIADAEPGTLLVTRVLDGTISSTVDDVRPREDLRERTRT